ncbi:MAG: lysine 2,3-aminomutase [Candidatus Omnitrophica bacterium]|nr:lysine 2,3-aminomutase [Candidatus Omnitrophota bacterium]MBD3268599.1 lysine 2,3-aminomutase [Candidatus Omnitrophota bacterium]
MEFYRKNTKKIQKNFSLKGNGLNSWRDYKWQLSHSIRNIDTFEHLTGIKFEEDTKKKLQDTVEKFPISITPYYASLIDGENYIQDPIFKQSFPDTRELDLMYYDMKDPLSEDEDSPVTGITHRYPDRVLFALTNTCSMYCRHCTRKRKVSDVDYTYSRKQIKEGIKYIKETTVVRDVLISGGDPFMLSDDYLDWVLSEIRKIPHVEVMRIGTRMPAVLPYRITNELVKVLKKYKNLWINTQFNHPRELTETAEIALAKLADSGIPLGNQTVLLAGVNDCPRIMKKLMHRLVQNRVRPYYLYQCDLSEGLNHFRTPVGKGIEIMENMIGHTSGFATPRYVIDAPGGGGKIPIIPNYIISWSTNKVVLRNFEGTICVYKEPDSYLPQFCDRNCDNCNLQLKLEPAREYNPRGIVKLLSDVDKTVSLVPQGTERIKRRKKR